MALQQENRVFTLQTPLGENELVLTAFRGTEEMSRLFWFELEMISDNPGIMPADIVGKNVTLSVKLADDSLRHFNGCVTEFSAGDEADGRRNYTAVVRPQLWFLTRTSDCRIFQKMTIIQIIEQIFGDFGVDHYDIGQVKGSHPEREYCVQYGQTAFDFVSRLMEEEGVFYFFKHEDGKHTMVLADNKGAYVDCLEDEVDFPRDYGSRPVSDHITRWENRQQFRTGKIAQQDFNFETPSTNLMTNVDSIVDLPGIDKYEFYDYPGRYGATGDGDPLTKVRMEEEEVEHNIVVGASACKSFLPGGKFKIGQHRSSEEEGQTYVLLAVEHEGAEPLAYETGVRVEAEYSNNFSCFPDSITFRAACRTPKPLVKGPQTAVVVGPPGEEIWPDKHGRVKAQFHWDREGKKDENSSCWIRVSQVYAGKGWGAMCIPRIGQEVLVQFLEGDPDRPIITGRVFNGEQTPPYPLPDGKNISGLKSNSTPGGGGYNELIFDDTAGNELVRVHAQFDMDSTIENDLREHVLNNRRYRDVAVDESIAIGANQSVSVGKDQTITVDGSQDSTIAGDQTFDVGANQSSKIGADRSMNVGNNQTTDIATNQTITVGANRELKVGANRKTNVGANEELTVTGKQTIQASGPIEIKSNASITLSVGGSTIKIHPGGIDITSAGLVQIQGATVKIN